MMTIGEVKTISRNCQVPNGPGAKSHPKVRCTYTQSWVRLGSGVRKSAEFPRKATPGVAVQSEDRGVRTDITVDTLVPLWYRRDNSGIRAIALMTHRSWRETPDAPGDRHRRAS